MRKFYLLTLLAFLPLLANADRVEIDGIYYNLNAENHTAEVTIKPGGSMEASAFSNYSGDMVIPETVTYEEVTYTVTSIGFRAISGCDVKSVVIPNSVTTIGDDVFEQSYQLTSVTIGSSVISIGGRAFRNCRALTSIFIPASVTSIGEGVLSGCEGLTSIKVEDGNPNYDSRGNCNALIETASSTLLHGCKNTIIPDGIKVIATGAFSSCSSLTSVTIPNSVTSIGGSAFFGCSGLTSVTIPNSVISIGEFAFSGCSGMTSLGLGSGLTTIGSNAFYGCSGFTSVTIPASVLSIGEGALAGCIGLQSIQVESGNTKYDSRNNCNAIIETANNNLIIGCNKSVIPSSVTSIGKDAFKGCNELTFVTIASGITSIGEGAFSGCSGLASIVVEAGNTVYDSRNNSSAIIETASGVLLAGCKNTIIPDGVKTIGKNAFSGCKDLTSISIPNSVTTIDEGAFRGCGLTSVTIPNSVIIIGKNAFQSCESLNSLSIGINVNTINGYAFEDCNSLTSITIPNSVATIGGLAFMNCGDVTTITIGSGIESLGYLAFNTYKLTDVYCLAENLPTDNGAFTYSGIGNATLHVPAGSIDAYTAATPWSGFKEVVAIESKKTINVETAGTLSTLIPETEKYLIEDLVLTGNLNGDDLALIRDMAGSDYNGFPTDGKLSFLDMSGATIVAGGEYVELVDENIYYNREIGNFHGGFDKDPQVSEANTLGKNVFAGCSKLETMIMPTGVVTVGERAFSDTSLKDIVWPTSLATIGYEAFFGCKFTSFTLPASVESVGGNILKYCSTLELSVESGNSNYDSRDNCNAIIETSTNTLIGGCKNTIIPNSVTSIGVEAFCGCASGLLSLTIPSSVTSIGYDAFEACSDLVHVYCNAEVVPTTDADAFKNVDIRNRVTLHVPAGSVEAYQAAAPWSGFNKVVALSTNIPDVEIQGVYYNLNEETLTAEVTKNPNGPYSGDLIVGGGIWYDSRLYSVTSIGKDAFALNGGITSVSIQEGVTTIGEGAFGYCPYLTSVTFPSSLISIGGAAFYGCERLTSVTIPANVTSISDNSFRSCKSLASIQVEDGNTKYDSRNDCNAIIEKENNTLISGCKNTVIPDNVTSIGVWAFEGISGLTSVTIPNSVTSIGAWSFAGTGLTSLAIPASVTTIDNDAFTNCSNLASIQVADGNTTFDSRDNSKAIIETATNTLIRASNTTVIPSSVSSIGYRAFGGSGITSITIPSTITSIEYMAFVQCKDLESISVESGNTKYDSRNNCNAIIETETNTLIAGCKNTIIPNTVTTIGQYAFGALGLTSITIPGSVTSIDHVAFWGNIELTDVYCNAESVPNTETDAFSSVQIEQVTLHVPVGCVEAYQAASPWKDFGAIYSSVTSLFDGTNLWTSYVAQEDYAIPAGLEAYVISSLTETSAVASQIDYIPQGVPILLKRNDATTNSFDFTIGTGTAPTTNLLKVYDTDKTVSNREGYILFKDEFVLVDEGTLPAGKVFLPLNGGNAANTRGIVIEGEGTTGIQNLVSDSEVSHGVWYDLQGRKIDGKPIKKGVYILNGRKVVVK